MEEHIYSSHKAGYVDNVGSMYRLPKPSQPHDTIPGIKSFEIAEFLRYVYSPDGLDWADGRPAVLAALIYIDRIRAHGRIISKRSVHRLLTAAILVGHEFFTSVMKSQSADVNLEPAPESTLCGMVFLTLETMEPLITRLKGMMDFEQSVLETDVTGYVGALKGNIELTDELRDLGKKERPPGQQGLSCRKDGMDAIRSWIEVAHVSCKTNVPLVELVEHHQPKQNKPSRLSIGGAASKVAVLAMLKLTRSSTLRLYVMIFFFFFFFFFFLHRRSRRRNYSD